MSVAVLPHRLAPDSASSLLRTLVLCDLVDSTALVERLGDRTAAELIRKHDRLARAIADGHGGREIDKTDGFLMMFERPIEAVAFALEYLRGLRQLNAAEGSTLTSRVGIHVGDVVVWTNTSADITRGAKPLEVEGLVKPIAARLTSLALPGQILMSNVTYSLAHRAQGELGEWLEAVRWRNHGNYRFHGIPDPVAVFEVGETDHAPLRAPPWSSKGHREFPVWRRPLTIGIQVVAVLALVLVPVYMMVRPEPAIAFANRDWVIVGDLNNLTGEAVFDETVQAAFRISLEQSRFVNVMPDLKVRQTLAQMGENAESARLDRSLGSEVAIRDGVRALILPTIAEVGGRVRITAEVIDPHSQTTVYSESAEGVGAQSVLPSLDTINSRLRMRLGEAMASVSAESEPLDRVATRSLDALRAYSLAMQAGIMGDSRETIALFRNAIALDEGFARARIGLAQEYFAVDMRVEARAELNTALATHDRISKRDELLARAWLANYDSPRAALTQWSALSNMYPDLHSAQGPTGYYRWTYANDYLGAIKATRQATMAQNVNRGLSHYLLGTLLLGQERYTDSLEQFAQAEELNVRFQKIFHAYAYAAQRDYPLVPTVLARSRPADMDIDKASEQIMLTTLAVDQGHWNEVSTYLKSLQESTPSSGPLGRQQNTLRLVLGMLVAEPDARASWLISTASGLNAKPVDERSFDPSEWNANLLFRAWLAYRLGQPVIARSLLAQTTDEVKDNNYPALDKLSKLVEAERLRSIGKVDAALGVLYLLLDGSEPFITHLSLMDAHADKGDYRAAHEHSNWMRTHRGRAYTEVINGEALIPFHVALSTLAELYCGEFALKLGQTTDASQSLQQVRSAWPENERPHWISTRIHSLATGLLSAQDKTGISTQR